MSFEEKTPDPEPDAALRHALDQWPRPETRGDFRERLRDKFLAAPFEPRATIEAEAEDLGPAPIVAPQWGEVSTSTGRGPETERPRRRPWMTLATVAAVAAAILLLYRWPSSSGWRVAPSSDFVLVRVGGQEFFPKDRQRLAAALEPGSLIEVEGGALDLQLDTRVALSLASGCVLTLVEVPEPEVLADLRIHQERGSLAVVTGPGFDGPGLRVQTPDAEVRITGTRFAVDVIENSGTCVCCDEDSVSVFDAPLPEGPIPEATPEHRVAQRERTFVFSDHRPVESGPAIAEHLAPIEALRQVWTAQH